MSKKKIIASSILSLAMCASVITGATYALFTSESETNISINAGNVKLVATLNLTGTSSMGVDMPKGTFENGGTASIDEGTITLERMTPGDKAEFEILLDNQSNVAIQYQTIVKQVSDTGLFDGLVIMIEGEEFTTTKVYDWVFLAEKEQPADNVIEVSVELPEDAGNEYQGTSTQLSVAVNAVQGNATTENPDVNTMYIYTASDLVSFAKSVNAGNNYSGKTVMLANDINMAGVDYTPAGNVNAYPSHTFAGTFDGANHTISNLVASSFGEGGVASAGLFGSITGVVQNVIIDKATITSSHYAGGIVGYSSANVGMKIENCKVMNSSITSAAELLESGEYDNGDKVGGIIGYMVKGDVVTGCTVENTKISGYRDIGGIVGIANGECTVTNNKVLENVQIVVNKFHNYKAYTTDAQHDANSIVGEGTADESNTGTATIIYENVLYIENAAQLKEFSASVNSGTNYEGATVRLAADIDLANDEWTPIGNTTNQFDGVFDGKGKTIKNLKISSGDNVGLFGYVYSSTAVIKNIVVENANVSGGENVGVIAGCVVLQNENTISNCDVKGTVTVNGTDNVGGVVGYLWWTDTAINGCDVSGALNITGVNNVGGIVGFGDSHISNCTVKASSGSSILATGDYVGGICGMLGGEYTRGEISDCSVNGVAITTATKYAGGISGMMKTSEAILGCSVSNIVLTANGMGVNESDASNISVGYIVGANNGGNPSGSPADINVNGWSVVANCVVGENVSAQKRYGNTGDYTSVALVSGGYNSQHVPGEDPAGDAWEKTLSTVITDASCTNAVIGSASSDYKVVSGVFTVLGISDGDIVDTRVLADGSTAKYENGVYVVTAE